MAELSFYCILQFARADSLINLAVFLYSGTDGSVSARFRDDYNFAASDEIEVLSLLHSDLVQKFQEAVDPIEVIEKLEDLLSNSILITERYPISGDLTGVLDDLYQRHVGVQEKPRIIFRSKRTITASSQKAHGL